MEENRVQASERKSSPHNVILSVLRNPRVLRVAAYTLAIFVFVYMILAMLSFLGAIPAKTAKKLPVISSVVSRKEELEELGKNKPVTPYQLNTKTVYPKFSRTYRKEDPYLIKPGQEKAEAKDEVVMKRRFNNGKNVGEIFLNDQLVMRISDKGSYDNEYARADAVTSALQGVISSKMDILKLIPKMVDDRLLIVHDDTEVVEVNKADALINNSSQLQQAIVWVNNIRVAMGITEFLRAEDYAAISQKLDVQPPQEKTVTEVPREAPRVVPDTRVQETPEDRKKRLKKVVKVYEAMPSGEALDILQQMNNDQVVEILALMEDRKLSKILAIMEPERAARLTGMLANIKKEGR